MALTDTLITAFPIVSQKKNLYFLMLNEEEKLPEYILIPFLENQYPILFADYKRDIQSIYLMPNKLMPDNLIYSPKIKKIITHMPKIFFINW